MRSADDDRSEHTADLIAETYERLMGLADQTKHPAFARAARALWQTSSGGRPPIDDRAAIAEVQFLLSTGKAKTLNRALKIVSRAKVPIDQQRAYSERLRRKILAKKTSTKPF